MKNDYLLDKDFLNKIDNDRNRIIYVKLISLDIDENPREQIIGRITSGSINIDGTSSVRRTCSLSLIANELNINEYYWGLKTKFKCFIGLENRVDANYPNPIWFPMGTYLITSFSCNQALANFTISISGKDKMCLLNGDIGGTITALSVDFGQMTEQQKDGSLVKTKLLLKDIIREGVHEYAKEPYKNIIVNDLDEAALELIEYRGTEDFYLVINGQNGETRQSTYDGGTTYYYYDKKTNSVTSYRIDSLPEDGYDHRIELDLDKQNIPYKLYATAAAAQAQTDEYNTVVKVSYGEVIGYRLTTLTYAGDLIANIGENFTSVLDKIKTMLGDYEYFYDTDGNFIWQRRPTYINVSWNNIVQNPEQEQYVENTAYTSAVTYSFENSNLITAISHQPDIANVKNDYSIFGMRKTTSGAEIPVHIRYAIDQKPTYYRAWDGTIYTTEKLSDDELKEVVRQVQKQLYQEKLLTYPKQKLPEGLSDDWWDIYDWGEFYRQLTGEYPNLTIKTYKVEDTFMDLDSIFTPITREEASDLRFFNGRSTVSYSSYCSGKWGANWANKKLFVFDVVDGKLGYHGHNPTCTHLYHDYFMNLYHDAALSGHDFHAYIYKPQLPSQVVYDIEAALSEQAKLLANPVVDWREIIWRMADDYMKHSMKDPKYDLNPNNFVLIEEPDEKEAEHGGYYIRQDKYTLAENFHNQTTYYRADEDENGNIVYTKMLGLTKEQFEQPEIPWIDKTFYYYKEVTPDYVESTSYESGQTYYKYVDYTQRIREYNPDYYPEGVTGYEQYYTDIKSFWRDLYDPDYIQEYNPSYVTKAILDEDLEKSVNYYWFKNQEEEEYQEGAIYYTLDLYKNFRAHKVSLVSRLEFENNPDDYYLPVQCDANKAYTQIELDNNTYKKDEYYILNSERIARYEQSYNNNKNAYERDLAAHNAKNKDELTGEALDAYNAEGESLVTRSKQLKQEESRLKVAQRVKDKYILCDEEVFRSTYTYFKKNPDYAYDKKRIYYTLVDREYYDQYEYGDTENEFPNRYWNKNIWIAPEKLDFWFDFLDTEGELGKFSVKRIGDRPKTENNNNIKAVYYRETPNVIFVNTEKERNELKTTKPGYTFLSLNNNINNLFTISSQGQSCKDKLNSMLYDYAVCKQGITLTTIPIYYLQPNTRIFITDLESGINGEYIISRLGYNLNYNGTLSITASKAVDRIY